MAVSLSLLPISKLHSILAVANVASKWASKHLGGTIYFAVDGISLCSNTLYLNNLIIATMMLAK